jgi:hypothetical protein
MAVIMTVNGALEPCEPANGLHFTLEEMQRAVGGHVESLEFEKQLVLLFNEEGGPTMLNLPPNRLAIQWAAKHGQQHLLYGPVVLCHFQKGQWVP